MKRKLAILEAYVYVKKSIGCLPSSSPANNIPASTTTTRTVYSGAKRRKKTLEDVSAGGIVGPRISSIVHWGGEGPINRKKAKEEKMPCLVSVIRSIATLFVRSTSSVSSARAFFLDVEIRTTGDPRPYPPALAPAYHTEEDRRDHVFVDDFAEDDFEDHRESAPFQQRGRLRPQGAFRPAPRDEDNDVVMDLGVGRHLGSAPGREEAYVLVVARFRDNEAVFVSVASQHQQQQQPEILHPRILDDDGDVPFASADESPEDPRQDFEVRLQLGSVGPLDGILKRSWCSCGGQERQEHQDRVMGSGPGPFCDHVAATLMLLEERRQSGVRNLTALVWRLLEDHDQDAGVDHDEMSVDQPPSAAAAGVAVGTEIEMEEPEEEGEEGHHGVPYGTLVLREPPRCEIYVPEMDGNEAEGW